MEHVPANFSNQAKAARTSDIWAKLEQVYNHSSEAKLDDLAQMLARVRSGESAFEYISDSCPYVSVLDGIITIALDFYVFPSSMGLSYNLTTPNGTISGQEIVDVEKSFDVIFNGTDTEFIDYVFEGEFVPEMPYITPDGHIISNVEISVENNVVSLSEPVYTVLRANGFAKGYRHSVEMVLEPSWELESGESNPGYKSTSFWISGGQYSYNAFPIIHSASAIEETWTLRFNNSTQFNLYNSKGINVQSGGSINSDFVTQYFTLLKDGWSGSWSQDDTLVFTVIEQINETGYKVENIKNSITVSWLNEDGETEEDSIDLEIPPCVYDVLAKCPEGSSMNIKYNVDDNDKDGRRFVVYYNTCDGSVLAARWENNG